MSALLILFAGGLWGITLFSAAYFLTFFMQKKWIRLAVGVVAVVGLFTLPLRDEIKGAEEFEALCQERAVYQIAPNAIGQKFDLKYSSTDGRSLSGVIRPVDEMSISFTDIATGEVVATGKAYIAKGGWLVRHRLLMNSGGGDGAFLGRPQCFPGDMPGQAGRIHAITRKIVN